MFKVVAWVVGIMVAGSIYGAATNNPEQSECFQKGYHLVEAGDMFNRMDHDAAMSRVYDICKADPSHNWN